MYLMEPSGIVRSAEIAACLLMKEVKTIYTAFAVFR